MKKLLLFIFVFIVITKLEAQVNLLQTNYLSTQNFQFQKKYPKYPKKYNSLLKTNLNYKNWFHIGIGASGFTYFLWLTDQNNEYWVDVEKAPYIGFSYMPEVTIQLGNRISWYLSLGWTGMSEFENMWTNKKANTIPPTNIEMTPIVTMTGISFGINGYEANEPHWYNKVSDVYWSPAKLSLGVGFGNFLWNDDKYVSGVVAVISLEWYLFMLNFGSSNTTDYDY